MKTYQVLAARATYGSPRVCGSATYSSQLPVSVIRLLCVYSCGTTCLVAKETCLPQVSQQSDTHTRRWPLQDKDLTEMLIKSEEDRNSQANGEGRKASQHIPLAKPSGCSCDKIRLPLNKSSNFPTSGIVRQRSVRQQNKPKPIFKKRKKEVFRMLNLFVRDYT